MTATQQLFSGHLRPFPGIPVGWSASKQAFARRILADVREVIADAGDELIPGADVEDFWEDACRVSAAWSASGHHLALKDPGSRLSPWTPDEMARRLGPVATSEEGGDHARDAEIAHPIVQEHGGRGMMLGVTGVVAAQDVTAWLASRHRDHGVQRGVVKSTERKNGVWVIDLDSDPTVVARRLLAELDWTYVRLEECGIQVLAQDAIDLQWEYRLFVVDGELVSGAGCVEEFTPLDNDDRENHFDTRVRQYRGHLTAGGPSLVEDRPDIVDLLTTFGRSVAGQHGGTVVIDVALDGATGEPVVIELNGITNAGLYASDPWVVANALVTAHDRGYALPKPIDLSDLIPVTR